MKDDHSEKKTAAEIAGIKPVPTESIGELQNPSS